MMRTSVWEKEPGDLRTANSRGERPLGGRSRALRDLAAPRCTCGRWWLLVLPGTPRRGRETAPVLLSAPAHFPRGHRTSYELPSLRSNKEASSFGPGVCVPPPAQAWLTWDPLETQRPPQGARLYRETLGWWWGRWVPPAFSDPILESQPFPLPPASQGCAMVPADEPGGGHPCPSRSMHSTLPAAPRKLGETPAPPAPPPFEGPRLISRGPVLLQMDRPSHGPWGGPCGLRGDKLKASNHAVSHQIVGLLEGENAG